MKEELIKFLKANRAFLEFRKELLDFDLDETLDITIEEFRTILADGYIFYHKDKVTMTNWKRLDSEWQEKYYELLKEHDDYSSKVAE